MAGFLKRCNDALKYTIEKWNADYNDRKLLAFWVLYHKGILRLGSSGIARESVSESFAKTFIRAQNKSTARFVCHLSKTLPLPQWPSSVSNEINSFPGSNEDDDNDGCDDNDDNYDDGDDSNNKGVRTAQW